MTTAQIWVALGGTWTALIGVLVFGLRSIISGALVPRAQVEAMVLQWEARLNESREREQDWRTAYQNEAEASTAKDGIFAKLMAYAETADRVLQSLPRRKDE
jgi:hypothetical protein